jgi:rfaE bifunctional protein kinase chain/domain
MIITYERLNAMLDRFRKLRIAVVGDFFLDKYLMIDPSRDEPSLETWLTAYQVVEKRMSPGAAGTVCNNLHAMGVGRIMAIGFAGKDGEGYDLLRCLKDIAVNTDHLLRTDERATPTYMKPMRMEIVGDRELNRLDIKNFDRLPKEIEDAILDNLYDAAGKCDAIIALDQVEEAGCGTVTPRVKKALEDISAARKDLVVYGDSRAFISEYRGILVKCNAHELVRIFDGKPEEEEEPEAIARYGRKLSAQNGKPVFVTMGDKGILVVDGEGTDMVRAIRVEGPIDICGAGDSASAAIVSALCCGCTNGEAAFMANLVASITIQQIGTTGAATPEQIRERFRSL